MKQTPLNLVNGLVHLIRMESPLAKCGLKPDDEIVYAGFSYSTLLFYMIIREVITGGLPCKVSLYKSISVK